MRHIESFKLPDIVVLVTVRRKGLARAIALGHGEVGAKIAVVGRMRNLIEGGANHVKKGGRYGIAVLILVRKEQDGVKMVRLIMGTLGRIDILVNTRGTAALNRAADISVRDSDDVIEADLKSVFSVCKAVGREMIK